jgi:hypothetical protein
MNVLATLGGWVVLAMVSQTVAAGVMVVKYVGVKQGSFMGKPAMILSETPIGGGAWVM